MVEVVVWQGVAGSHMDSHFPDMNRHVKNCDFGSRSQHEREREREVFGQVLKSDQVTFPSAIFLNKSVTISLIICIRPEVASLAEQPSSEFGFL